jgi:hypothetical protein
VVVLLLLLVQKTTFYMPSGFCFFSVRGAVDKQRRGMRRKHHRTRQGRALHQARGCLERQSRCPSCRQARCGRSSRRSRQYTSRLTVGVDGRGWCNQAPSPVPHGQSHSLRQQSCPCAPRPTWSLSHSEGKTTM